MTQDPPQQNNEAKIEIGNDLNAKITRHHNVDQNIITITEDKTEIILRDSLKKLGEKKSWATPLGIFISLILIPITVEKFKSTFFIPAQSWKTIVYLAILISFIWLIITLWKCYLNHDTSIKDIINAMKKADNY